MKKSKNEKTQEIQMIPYSKLFKTATFKEKFYISLSILFAVIHGATYPSMFIFFGDMTENLTNQHIIKQCGGNYTLCVDNFNEMNQTYPWTAKETDEFLDLVDTNQKVIYTLVGLGVLVFFCGYAHIHLIVYSANEISERLRKAYFKTIIRQEMAFHHRNFEPGEIISHLNSDFDKIRNGIGSKLSVSVQNVAQFFSGIIIGFLYSWQLSLVIFFVVPFMVAPLAFGMAKYTEHKNSEEKTYAIAGEIAAEVIQAIRTIVSFGMEELELLRYDVAIAKVKDQFSAAWLPMGWAFGLMYFNMMCLYAIAFGFGTWLFDREKAEVGDILTAWFSVMIGTMGVSVITQCSEHFATAKAVGVHVYQILERTSKIDPLSEKGEKFENSDIDGNISLTNVSFTYPVKKSAKNGLDDMTEKIKEAPVVLKNLSLHIYPGETVAFVGPSGSGKSSIIKLIQRLYDVQTGSVKIDGKDVKNLNVKCLRNLIGLVQQEPVLFATSILENVTSGNNNFSEEEVDAALRAANAYDFVQNLPDKKETFVGEKGSQLSGGQKQRIAIARALINNPKILLLDEATSALDAESEAIVQKALDKVTGKQAGENKKTVRTTIIIAHRLSTIRKADRIFGIKNGELIEVGNHDELYKNENGLYRCLYDAQTKNEEISTIDFNDQNNDEDQKNYTQNDEKNEFKKLPSETKNNETKKPRPRHRASILNRNDKLGEDISKLRPVSMLDVLQWNKPEHFRIILGCLASSFVGALEALAPFLIISFLEVWAKPDKSEIWNDVWLYVGFYVMFGVIALMSVLIRTKEITIANAKLIRRIRYSYFKSLLNQEIGLFDNPMYPPAILTSRLQNECAKIEGAGGLSLLILFQGAGTVITSVVIAFIYSWKLSLLGLCFVPFLLFSGYFEMGQFTNFADNGAEDYGFSEDRNNEKDKIYKKTRDTIAFEATMNLQTVTTINKHEKLIEEYNNFSDLEHRKLHTVTPIRAVANGFQHMVLFFSFAAIFRFGFKLIENEELEFTNMFRAKMTIIWGAMAVGRIMGIAPDFSEAILAA